jgi:hypothetical protein
VVTKYVNRENCCCAIWNRHILILKIHITPKWIFRSLHPCVPETISWKVQELYTVCVCTVHQNVKLMLEASEISEPTRRTEHHLSTHQHCLSTMICNPLQTNCFFSVTAVNVQDLSIYKIH